MSAPMVEMTKMCVDCAADKPWSEFHVGQGGRPRSRCKPCMLAYNRLHRNPANHTPRQSGWARKRKSDPQWQWRTHLRRAYGMSLEDYARRLAGQEGVCAICRKPETVKSTLAVDHDHATGRIRGLLCNRCNLLLGKVHDKPETLDAAALYLRGC